MKKYLSENPKLVSEWHPTKNGDLRPEDFTTGSGKKIWWQCPQSDDHEWQAVIVNRSGRGDSCPFCSGRKASKSNNLLVLNPKLASDWHPTKNKDLKPEDFKPGSWKKVWWQCPQIDDHEWQTTINSRSAGSGCPFCSGRKASKSNNLLVLNPKLASEWHPTKNKDLKPEDFTLGSAKKVWWQCSKGDDHEWKTVIHTRVNGTSCPFCSGLKASKLSNLLAMNPELASEWHPTKNKDLKPEDFKSGSGKKVWWQCSKGDDHEWQTTINSRSAGHGCPFCAGASTSEPEIRILCELRYLMGSDEIDWRNRIDGVEIDIFLPRHNIGIEYDGFYWHEKKLQSDLNKNQFFQKKGIQIIRVREHPLQAISKNDLLVTTKSLNKDDLNTLILKIKADMNLPLNIEFDSYISNSSFLNEKEFKRFISFLPSPPPEYSILSTHPEVVKKWHYEKNSPLKPENFTKGSNKKVWWQCHEGEDHIWESKINNRIHGNDCPFCSGRSVGKSNNLLVMNPELASEWHPSKNKDLKPENFTMGSNKKVWWQCSKGDDHEWEASIGSRSGGASCPFCAGQRVSKSNNLLVMNPELASEWHPSKNKDLKPEDITPGSEKKVWWQCHEGEDHIWESRINNRVHGNDCPFCSGRKASKLSNLLAMNPELASEWHPTKNKDLKPEDFKSGSGKKVWWQCLMSEDHEWEAVIYSRSSGTGCPFCSGRVKKTDI